MLPTPAVGTTIIDNSLSTALANVLQLLIVSDLIESTLNTALGLRCAPVPNSICEPIVPQPISYTPIIDVVKPVVEYISPPCAPCPPVVDIIPQCGPVIDFIPPCGQMYDAVPQYGPAIDFIPPCGQIYDFMPQCGPVIDYIPPCSPVYDFVPTCGQYIEPLPNFYGDCLPPVANLATYPSPNSCGGIYEYISPVSNSAPMYTQNINPNLIAGLQDIGPVQMAPIVPNCYNSLTEVIRPMGNTGPFAEILFPSAIPAQLTCNIGTIPTSLPCVSVNVEPLPCGCGYGNNVIGNPYFY